MKRQIARARASGGTLWRMLDANANRAREGLRVAEDVLRFVRGDSALSMKARKLRHAVGREAEALAPRTVLLAARDSAGDVGARQWRGGKARRNAEGLLAANLRRAQESARVMEECARLLGKSAAIRRLQSLRYSIYDLESRANSGRHGRNPAW